MMTCACPAWELEAGSYLLKLQRLQNKVLRTIGDVPRRTPTRDLDVAFRITYLYDFVTKLCRQQTIIILNHENVDIHNIGQGRTQEV
jgi:hypothetical protein